MLSATVGSPICACHSATGNWLVSRRYYEQVKARRGTGKAIIALAPKLLGIIYRTLKKKWVFEDFPNFVLAEV